MPNVKCPLETCGHRKKNGYCGRKSIELSNQLNEIYCMSWDEPEIRMFKQILANDPDVFQKT